MKNIRILMLAAFAAASASGADDVGSGFANRFDVKADRIAVDRVTGAAVATGHVVAVCAPASIRSEAATRDTNGVTRFTAPTVVTTCTNHPGICHWDLRGEIEYKPDKYIKGRNIWLDFYEIPVFWLPFFYYPLDGECSFRIMPGYTKRWGAYVMMKYNYGLFGDSREGPDAVWAYADTRLDLRWENGIALGEDVNWNLGRLGAGHFKVYYAWDEDYDRYDYSNYGGAEWNSYNWGSTVPHDRYALELAHRLEVTERDTIRLLGAYDSDSYMHADFFRNSFLTIANQWNARNRNELAWEHVEDACSAGVSASGPLNEFHGGTARLPEAYFDVSPVPVWLLPVNYESQSRAGYLARQYAKYGNGDPSNPFAFNPGPWANYATFRFDTYHRLTAPFKVADVVSVVPRVAYRGTFWNDGGNTSLDGWDTAGKHNGEIYRSILEGGATFSGRGKAWLSERWRHVTEPYLDVLAQEAWYSGTSDGNRPYVFDGVEGSADWLDQFAGRSRNLPYSYYGVTPGWRNAFERADDKGAIRTLFDFDVYGALQFRHADWVGTDDSHKLAEPGSPNYGKSDIYVAPGFRARWMPDEDLTFRSQLEYDPDNNALAYGDVGFQHRLNPDFSWNVDYNLRDYRRWDFSSAPYSSQYMTEDSMNLIQFQYVRVGFTHQPLDWFAWQPFISWDCNDGELDSCGAWFDYLTDCLGFRLILEYENEYWRVDGSRYGEDFHVGFFIYLRALGPASGDLSRL